MALVVTAWNLPPPERIEAYTEKAKTWIATVLAQPDTKEWRVYRNPLHATPNVVAHQEFHTLESALQYLESEARATVESEMRAVGCTEFVIEVWDASSIAPEPLKPPSG
jgi:hypothetical protein